MTHNITYAIAAIRRLNARRIGRYSFDACIDFAIRDWHKFIHDEFQRGVEPIYRVDWIEVSHETAYGSTQRLSRAIRVF